MILKFYGKILLVCFLSFSFSSCDELKGKPVASKKVKLATQKELPPKIESSPGQRQSTDSLPETKTSQDDRAVGSNPVSEEDSTASDSTVSKATTIDVPDESTLSLPAMGIETAQGKDGSHGEADTAEVVPSASTKVLQKTLKFPQEESLEFTLEQVKNFDFLKNEGSDLFYYYVLFWFNNIGGFVPRIKNPQLQESWSLFCYESDCSNGIDFKQMNESKMRSVIKKLSTMPPMLLSLRDKAAQEREESVFFLQGRLAPKGWDRGAYMQGQKGDGGKNREAQPPHIIELLHRLDSMRQKNIKKIAINLPPQLHKDPEPFILLGKFIKERKIDLHIVGGCEHYCASYLIPAARTVYMEPYGYIYRGGSFRSLILEIWKITESQREEYIKQFRVEWLSGLTYEERVNFVVEMLRKSPPENLPALFQIFQNRLKVKALEQANEFQEKFNKFRIQIEKLSLSEWTEENWQEFIKSFSPALLESLALYFKVSYSQKSLKASSYSNRLQGLAKINMDYYGEIQVENLVYHKDYSFFDLNLLFGFLLKDSGYAEHFSLPRSCYSVPEKEKPYEWIVPSVELLRDVGIDIKGKNNVEMLDFTANSFMLEPNEKITVEQFLYLDSEGIKSCGFFEEDACDYTTETLKECLSDGNLPHSFHSFQTGQEILPNKHKSVVPDTEEIDTASPLKADDKNLNFPEDENWKFTLEQIANFDFIKKGGSDFFHYYVQFLFNKISYFLTQAEPDTDYRETLKGLCYESDCSKGFNPQQAATLGMSSIIRLLSFMRSFNSLATDPDTEESLFFLQGRLAPEGWDQWLYIQKRDREKTLPHIQDILNSRRWMEKQNVQRIAVNLLPQFHEDPTPFIILGEFIKRKQIDLHIMGGCGHYCATYLVPAARTVYIEPYGYIYHKGNFTGHLADVKEIFDAQNEKYMKEIKEQWLSPLKNEKIVDFVTEKIVSSTDRDSTINNLLTILQKDNLELEKEFKEELGKFEFRTTKTITEGEEEEINNFVENFSGELLRAVAIFFKVESDDKKNNIFEYAKRLLYFSRLEREYYLKRINIENLKSQKSYGYIDFLMLSASLLKDSKYAESFSVPKFFYNIPEEDKPYEWIVPSAELLRSLGIDIRGKNNVEMIYAPEFLSMLDLSRENILYLDSKRIENCGFLEKDAHGYTTEKINECFAHE